MRCSTGLEAARCRARSRGDAAARSPPLLAPRRPRRAGSPRARGQGPRCRSPRASSKALRAHAPIKPATALVAARRCVLRSANPTPGSSRSCSRARARSTRRCSPTSRCCFDVVRAVARLLALVVRPGAGRQPHRHRLSSRQRERRGEQEAPRRAHARHGRRQRGGVRRRHGDAVAVALARRRAGRDDGPQLGRVGGAGGLGRRAGRDATRARGVRARAQRRLRAGARRREDRHRRAARGRRTARRGGAGPDRRQRVPGGDRDGQLRQPAGALRFQGCDRVAPGRALRSGCHLPAAAVRPRLSHRGLRRRQRRLPRLLRPHQAAHAEGAALLLRLDSELFPGTRRRPCASSPRRSGRRQVRFRETIERMVADGVELLRRGRAVRQPHRIRQRHPAAPREQTAIASNLRRKAASSSCSRCSPQLYASGRPVRLDSAVRRAAHRPTST